MSSRLKGDKPSGFTNELVKLSSAPFFSHQRIVISISYISEPKQLIESFIVYVGMSNVCLKAHVTTISTLFVYNLRL